MSLTWPRSRCRTTGNEADAIDEKLCFPWCAPKRETAVIQPLLCMVYISKTTKHDTADLEV
jgi:hypothetical protein